MKAAVSVSLLSGSMELRNERVPWVATGPEHAGFGVDLEIVRGVTLLAHILYDEDTHAGVRAVLPYSDVGFAVDTLPLEDAAAFRRLVAIAGFLLRDAKQYDRAGGST